MMRKAFRSHSFMMTYGSLQYIPRNMHTVLALLCFVVVIHWLIFPYPSGLLHWHCGNLTIAPVPAKQPWWIWINTSCEFIMNDCITTTKQSTTKPCAYFLGYTVCARYSMWRVAQNTCQHILFSDFKSFPLSCVLWARWYSSVPFLFNCLKVSACVIHVTTVRTRSSKTIA